MRSIVICEKSSQRNNVKQAVGDRYGVILAAEGHLLELAEPGDVRAQWRDWSRAMTDVLYTGEPYPTKVAYKARGKSSAATKLARIEEALKTADRVWIATDCDREGQLIGQELVEFFGARAEIMRVMFNYEDPKSIRAAFEAAQPNERYHALYDAGRARQQCDQIYNLTLTRGATRALAPDAKNVLGVGRVKTPTLAIICEREQAIANFRPTDYFEIRATATVEAGSFTMRHAPGEDKRILDRTIAERIARGIEGFQGPIKKTVKNQSQRPPRPYDITSLQKACGRAFGWSAERTLEIAQTLYDGEGKQILSYPRTDIAYLPEDVATSAPQILTSLARLDTYATIEQPPTPVSRTGKNGTYWDKGLKGESHHALMPNPKTVDDIATIWERLDADEKALMDKVIRNYIAQHMPDYRYEQTRVTLDANGVEMRASGRRDLDLGWQRALGKEKENGKGEEEQKLPAMTNGEQATLSESQVDAKRTTPPKYYTEAELPTIMKEAWRLVPEGPARERLKEAKGIGTGATRPNIIEGLKAQALLRIDKRRIRPTDRGMAVWEGLKKVSPDLVDPALTAEWETRLDNVLEGKRTLEEMMEETAATTEKLLGGIVEQARTLPNEDRERLRGEERAPTPAMIKLAEQIAKRSGNQPPQRWRTSMTICKAYLDANDTRDPDRKGQPSDAALKFAERIAERAGLEIDEETRANAKALSTWIDKHKDKGAPPPSEKQRAFAERIANDNGQKIPSDVLESAAKLSKWIDTHKKARSPSAKQKEYAEAIAQRIGKSIPASALKNTTSLSAWIDKNKDGRPANQGSRRAAKS